jgi:hypothetical protein
MDPLTGETFEEAIARECPGETPEDYAASMRVMESSKTRMGGSIDEAACIRVFLGINVCTYGEVAGETPCGVRALFHTIASFETEASARPFRLRWHKSHYRTLETDKVFAPGRAETKRKRNSMAASSAAVPKAKNPVAPNAKSPVAP